MTNDEIPEATNTVVTAAVVEAPSGAPSKAIATYAGRPQILAQVLREETEQRKLLKEFVREHMIDGTDFGKIPGTDKPTLLKPGAEKITDLFRCTPEFEILQRIEQWTDESPLFYYVFRCRIMTRESGSIVAEGFGSANSREGRYRWRNADRACPKCGKAAILRSKYPPRNAQHEEPGWYCYAKKNGCGANFSAKDPSIIKQEAGKVENDDPFSLVNTVLKMAKKRAYVDAAISLARCSDIFTQDVEDMGQDYDEQPARQSAPPPSSPTTSSQASSQHHYDAPPTDTYRDPFDPDPPGGPALITREQQEELFKLFRDLNLAWHNDKARGRISELLGRPIQPNEPISNLTVEEFPRLRDALREGVAKKSKAGAA